jgi:hypothetical protein
VRIHDQLHPHDCPGGTARRHPERHLHYVKRIRAGADNAARGRFHVYLPSFPRIEDSFRAQLACAITPL